MRSIIHIDMDAFFASVEQRDNPELAGKPIAIGFDESRGVVSTASYEARKWGVHSAMPITKAKQLCKNLEIVPPRMDAYKEISMEVHDIFKEYTDCIEPLSIDEAFLDVSPNDISMAVSIAEEIRGKIKEKLKLTSSAGVSYNKFLAKIASDYNKPDGLFVIPHEQALSFIASLPIERFWGVGPKTTKTMHKMGIYNGAQLRQCPLPHLTDVFGKQGYLYHDFANGIDLRTVTPERTRKSIGCERTFQDDIMRNSAVIIELYHIVIELVERLKSKGFTGHTLTLKIKFHDFVQITRSTTRQTPIGADKDKILSLAKELLKGIGTIPKPIRLIGLSVSNSPDELVRSKWVEGYLDFQDDI